MPSPSPIPKSLWLALLLPGLLAAVSAWLDPVVGSDGLRYLFPVHHWLAGQGWSFLDAPEVLYPPGYGLTAVLFYQIWPDVEFSGIAVMVVSFGLIGPLLMRWLHPLVGTVGAVLVAVFVYMQPSLLSFATTTMTECLYILVCLALYKAALDLWQNPASLTKGMVVGLLAGYGYLIRPEMIGIGGALVTLLLGRVLLRHGQWNTIAPTLLACLLFACFLLGYGLMQKELSGRFAFTGKGVTSMHTMESREHRQEMDSPTSGHGQSIIGYFLSKDRDWVIQRWKVNFWRERHMVLEGILPALLLLGLAVLVKGVSRFLPNQPPPSSPPIPWLSWLMIGSCFAIPLLVYPFFMVNQRYLLPVVIPMVVVLVLASAVLLRDASRYPVMPVILALALLFLANTWQTGMNPTQGHQGLRQAGLWLAQDKSIPLEKVATPRKRMILAFYALDKRQVLPDTPIQARYQRQELKELLHHYREMGYTHLVLDWLYAFDNPSLAQLWNTPAHGLAAGAKIYHEEASFKIFTLFAPP